MLPEDIIYLGETMFKERIIIYFSAFILIASSCSGNTAGKSSNLNEKDSFANRSVLIDSTHNNNDTVVTNTTVPYEGFVYVKSYIPDVIVDLRYFTTNNFMGTKADGYESNNAILSKQAAEALKQASDEFRNMGYVIKIYDAYRPQRAVDHFVKWSHNDDESTKDDYYPTLNKKDLFPNYIARKSGHSRGSTIDMTICYKDTGKEVDMGGHFDYFGPPSHPNFQGKYEGGNVTSEHQKNRMILRQVMMNNGFKPYSNEWWHFTLIDEPYPNDYFDFPVK